MSGYPIKGRFFVRYSKNPYFRKKIMSSSGELYRDRSLRVEVSTHSDEYIRQHVGRTILGTPGKMLYRQVGAVGRMLKLRNIWFLSLKKRDHLLGTVGLVFRQVATEKTVFNAWYVRYFSIFAPFRAKKKHRTSSMKSARESAGQNLLKDMLITYFDQLDTLNPDPSVKGNQTISYAFVEKENHRSIEFSGFMGYQTIREFKTFYFSRFFPKKVKNVRPARPEEIKGIHEQLEKMYAGYMLYFEDYLFINDHYYILLDKGEIVAGVQAEAIHWEIVEMPGFMGWITMNLVPKLPLLSRIFDPDNFTFCSFEGLWYKEGYQNRIPELFESVCALQKQHTGMLWADTGSRLAFDLNAIPGFGFLSKIQKSVPGTLRIKFVNVSREHQKQFFEKPAYISAFDIT